MDIKDIQKAIPSAATLQGGGPKAKSAAKDFEALLLQQMMDTMWKTVPQGMLTDSQEEETFRGMLSQAVAGSISDGGGLGIQEVILRDMEKQESNKKLA